jgi:hypothetical protein
MERSARGSLHLCGIGIHVAQACPKGIGKSRKATYVETMAFGGEAFAAGMQMSITSIA